MRLNLSFDVGPLERRAINVQHGLDGLATYEQVARWIRSNTISTFEAISTDLDDSDYKKYSPRGDGR